MDQPGEIRACPRCETRVVYVRTPTGRPHFWVQHFDSIEGNHDISVCPGCGGRLYYTTTRQLPREE